ncbi:MAG TPA: peptidoglycan editing factor PgeF [Chitinophagales bacterium]|nr:peptidoglycan editing factor PgeF [Chitinophagales bacterium]
MTAKSYFSSKFEKTFPHLIMRESRRNGGISQFPYESLNLGLNTQDDIQSVLKNRQIFFDLLEISSNQIVGSLQVHDDIILEATESGYFSGYDAFVTNQRDLFLTIGIADCTPILIFDPITSSIGAAHAGWKGTAKSIASKTLQKMQEFYGTNPKDCFAFIGTCIDTANFEVGEEVAEKFDKQFVHYFQNSNRPHIDLKAANLQQLLDIGIPIENIEISEFSTVLDNEHYFSYRKENGQTGRMLAVIGIRA